MGPYRTRLLLAGLLALTVAGCASSSPAGSAVAVSAATARNTASDTASRVPASESAAAAVSATDPTDGRSLPVPATGTGIPTPTAKAPAIAASSTAAVPPAPAVTASSPPAAAATPPIALAPPTLAVWSPPADALALPEPDGPAAVGIAASGFPDTVVFYPAVAGTGRGRHRYIEPAWASVAGLDPTLMDRVVSAAQIDATPAAAEAPRPVVLLTPGWRSVVALSTSLAEDLASHGYVVLATQTDVAAEWSHSKSIPEDRDKRFVILQRLLDFIHQPSLAALVGPIDFHRVAVGGHSYAGSVAFDASLTDRRIAVMFDLDGSARGEASRTPPTRPALVLVTVNNGAVLDPLLGGLAARSAHIVPVGVLQAMHLDVTDAASIPSLLGTSVFSTMVGDIGSTGTTETSTIVQRFLDAALGPQPRQPSSAALVHGLPSATADPFGSQTPA